MIPYKAKKILTHSKISNNLSNAYKSIQKMPFSITMVIRDMNKTKIYFKFRIYKKQLKPLLCFGTRNLNTISPT
jgi:outer membrane lipoprotein-sorting protein